MAPRCRQSCQQASSPRDYHRGWIADEQWPFFTQAISNLGPKGLPKYLDFGQSVEISFDLPEIEKAMTGRPPERVVLTAAFVRDAEGKEYASRLPRILKDKGLAK